ncbi:GH1 family beta-glucosidase [Flavihumibacter rivuli]|uniref:GH1 family beta-glucosidase n=1 Tax=Flavihumibacter rivuli TaxID=2838156 RepID=UPI001BDE1F20|nr:GH1 family beta-glucosidase [Flavihumibacter rivuli]ULQ57877.1 GH1 family beta-glucosidase [Flavihumibacter rivuli]
MESNRRKLLKALGATGLGLSGLVKAAEAIAASPKEADPQPSRPFPGEFYWGTATAAFQVEGAVNEDGRGKSIWDIFSHTPGKIKNNWNADVAVDMYHRYREDVGLMKALGTNAYRFSISWPRIFPEGKGSPNQKGIDFYKRLVDTLLENGIQPFATLYHWDLPQALQAREKGWQSRSIAEHFAAYAGYVASQLGDRVKHFFTLNEMFTFVEWGHGTGLLAPGLKLSRKDLNQVRHHVVLAHGLAMQAIKAAAPGVKAGPAENMVNAVPAIATPEHIKAAQEATRQLNAGYLTVMLEGQYTNEFLEKEGKDAPRFTEAEMKAIGTPVDFAGINVYMPNHYVMASDAKPGYELLPFTKVHPKMASSWHYVGPEALYWGPRHMKEIWGVKEIYITENGCGAADEQDKEGRICDTDRVMFLRNYLLNMQQAIEEGIPVKGYFHWSLMDNFEWVSGYATRFGLYYVDYKTLQRIPKLSADFYREVIKAGRVL